MSAPAIYSTLLYSSVTLRPYFSEGDEPYILVIHAPSSKIEVAIDVSTVIESCHDGLHKVKQHKRSEYNLR